MPNNKAYSSLKEKYTRFTWTKPVGYDFEEVEETILEYKQIISDCTELLNKKDEYIDMQNQKIAHLTKQLTEIQIQLESLDVPVYDEETSINILKDFKEEASVTLVDKVVSNQEEQFGISPPSSEDRHKGQDTSKMTIIE